MMAALRFAQSQRVGVERIVNDVEEMEKKVRIIEDILMVDRTFDFKFITLFVEARSGKRVY